jgi:hypothetical protein
VDEAEVWEGSSLRLRSIFVDLDVLSALSPCKTQIASLSLSFRRSSRQLLDGAWFAPQVVAFFCCVVLGGYAVSKPVTSLESRKTGPGASTLPQSQRCEVSTSAEFLSREKR